MKATALLYILLITTLLACSKQQGKNPGLAYTDMALADSCNATYHHYYKNNAAALHFGAVGSNAQHGPFKLRFNTIAYQALSDSGRLPANGKMPDGALVVKDIYKGSELDVYAIMYKHKGTWLWAEIKPNKQVLYSVSRNPGVCTGCHSQAGNRDFLRTFSFY